MAREGRILLNTDILLHAADSTSRLHQQAYNVREMAAKFEIKACVSMSILNEMLVALTSEGHVRNPVSVSDALGEYEKYVNLKTITKIMNLKTTFRSFNNLVKKYTLKGSEVKLAEVVATMVDNNVHTLCTFNQEDYEKFTEIDVLNPFEFDNRQTLLQLFE